MGGYKGPLDIPVVGAHISAAVRRFASNKQRCEFELWYHDEPVWFVRDAGERGFYRQVQIAAFLTEQGEHLFFTPFAYAADGAGLKITPCDPTQSLSVPLFELYRMDSAEDIVQKVEQNLVLAWKQAESFQKKDATA
jgi:hypothetical protein